MDISYIRTIQNAKGSDSKRETKLQYNRKKLKKAFSKNLENIIIQNVWTKEYKEVSVNKQKHEDWGWYLQSTALLDANLGNGDTFYYEEGDRKEYYQIQNMEKNQHYLDFDLVECNYMLRWQDDNRVIKEFPCVMISASQYNSGEKQSKTLTLGYNQIMMRIMCNDDTIKFKSDKRFFVDNELTRPKVYRITREDTIHAWNQKGFMEIILTEDEYNADTDNIEKFICDYQAEADDNIVVSFKGEPEIRIGQTKTLESNVPVTWSVVADYITLTVVDDTHCKIKCNKDTSLVGNTFEVMANDVATQLKVVGIL